MGEFLINTSGPPRSKQAIDVRGLILAIACGCFLVLIALYALMVLPLPTKRTLYQEDSPDGTMTAVYSFRPAGLVGLVTGESSYIYLDVYRKDSKARLVHSDGFGDVPWEAVDRLHNNLPWPAKLTTGNHSML